ncbi:MAG: hypothetical protein GF331_04775 [Chitinivibrionales bacterium]|nr:hypothetical protein [Chitinivibrionales bacterium]
MRLIRGAIILATVMLVGCSADRTSPPEAKRGAIDLRHWDFAQNGPVVLKGDWEFWWDTLITPVKGGQSLRRDSVPVVHVPNQWRHVLSADEIDARDGKATYRLTILLPPGHERYQLLIKQCWSACRVFCDGAVVHEQGTFPEPGGEPELACLPVVVPVPLEGDSGELVFHVATPHNPNHLGMARPGLWPRIELGIRDQLAKDLSAANLVIGIIVGAFLCLGLYHAVLFVLQRRHVSHLLFAGLCIGVATMGALVDKYILPVLLPIPIAIRLYGAGYSLTIASVVLFTKSLYPAELSGRAARVLALAAAVPGLAVIVNPMLMFGDTVNNVQTVLSVLVAVPLFAGLTKALIRHRGHAASQLVAFVLVYVGFTIDCVQVNRAESAGGAFLYGFMALLVAQAYALAHRHSIAEKMSVKHRDQLAHAEKLASLGTLVSGVAHEITSPNSAVRLSSSTLRRAWAELEPVLDEYRREHGEFAIGGFTYEEFKDEVAQALERTSRSSERIEKLVGDLRAFARKDDGRYDEDVDVNAVVRDALELIGPTVRKATRALRVALAEDIPHVKGNHQRLEQVVINLLNNARQALTDPRQGITVSTSYDSTRGSLLLAIADEGRGIDRKTLTQLKQPFFTTKTEAEGTGLGLSICRGIVERHGGSLDIGSKPGAGTQVRVLIPVLRIEKDAGERAQSPLQTDDANE